jgi:hypothetical protein
MISLFALEPNKGGFTKMRLSLKTLLLTTATVAFSWLGGNDGSEGAVAARHETLRALVGVLEY